MGLGGKSLDPLQCYGKGQLLVGCSFAPNAGSDPSAASSKGGLLRSVVWTSTGTWTLTLNCPVKAIIAIVPGAQLNSAANVDTSLQIGAVSTDSAGRTTVVVRNNPGGAVANIAADASNRINLLILVQTGFIK